MEQDLKLSAKTTPCVSDINLGLVVNSLQDRRGYRHNSIYPVS